MRQTYGEHDVSITQLHRHLYGSHGIAVAVQNLSYGHGLSIVTLHLDIGIAIIEG
jgi:hypothetical protein